MTLRGGKPCRHRPFPLGGIDVPQLAEHTVAQGQLDLVMIGRAHLANPHWPYEAAKALRVKDPSWVLPAPYAHWLERY